MKNYMTRFWWRLKRTVRRVWCGFVGHAWGSLRGTAPYVNTRMRLVHDAFRVCKRCGRLKHVVSGVPNKEGL